MPVVSPFRALRYDERTAGALDTLVAPPYDVIDDEARAAFLERSPYNIVHLTLPESPESAGSLLAEWLESGVLRKEEPALWWISQNYVGPDGVERTREGLAGAVEATPYAEQQVLPHERTHAGPKEGRLQVLRATRTQLEPIFLLYDADPPVGRPDANPELDVKEGGVRTRVWRLPANHHTIDAPFLIADGHHRYETAVAFREEHPEAKHTFAVLVSSRSPGLEIFPTHRLIEHLETDVPTESPAPWDPHALTLYRDGAYARVDSDDELDARAVERYAPKVARYTPQADDAVGAVDRGEAEAAFLVRAPTVEQVARFAARGETMPQKSTFFYPKLTSGLLLFPL